MFESRHSASISARSRWVTAFTVPCVATGIKTGVCICPRAVLTTAARAAVAGSFFNISKWDMVSPYWMNIESPYE
ncbi:MAG: hypothetical protein A2234_05265 [Elusimicrobia bacterium RIFOXYA2_FULL_58_8]|nr:MAG: hypothetical protein A2234_05265 [Elusimicrobia bacterium RIFOXYA2_FULL_58_8]